MIYDNEILPFPAVNKISFFKIFESLESLTLDPDPNVSGYAKNLLGSLAPYPELREGFTDKSLLITYEKEIHQLLRVIFPDVLLQNEIKAVTPPFDFITPRDLKRSLRLPDLVSSWSTTASTKMTFM